MSQPGTPSKKRNLDFANASTLQKSKVAQNLLSIVVEGIDSDERFRDTNGMYFKIFGFLHTDEKETFNKAAKNTMLSVHDLLLRGYKDNNAPFFEF